jgi:AraC-like DNA-binding protein
MKTSACFIHPVRNVIANQFEKELDGTFSYLNFFPDFNCIELENPNLDVVSEIWETYIEKMGNQFYSINDWLNCNSEILINAFMPIAKKIAVSPTLSHFIEVLTLHFQLIDPCFKISAKNYGEGVEISFTTIFDKCELKNKLLIHMKYQKLMVSKLIEQLFGIALGVDNLLIDNEEKTKLFIPQYQLLKKNFFGNPTLFNSLQIDLKEAEISYKNLSLQIINSHHKLLKLEEVASILNITPRTYQRRLRKENINFNELLKWVKLKKANQMLADNLLNISQIASNVGFEEPGAFNKFYKKVMGITPKEYRKNMLKAA